MPNIKFHRAARAALVVSIACLGPSLQHRSMVRAQGAAAPGAADDAALQALRWRNVGPNRGGRSISAAGSPGRPLEYYFGAVGGGLWKTTDGGTTWDPVTDGQLRSSSIGAVAVAESNPDIVYIGMGEACIRGNIMQGDGIYRSTDAGKTWRHVGLTDTQAIAKIRIHPTNPDIAFVAAFGHPAGPNEERGVYRTADGGATWKKVLFRDAKTGAVDVAIDRRNPRVVYAALWEAYRVSWQMSSGGAGSGLFKSTDGGDTWTEITRNPGLPSGVVGKIGIAVSGADSNRVYALVENDNGGVFRSDDAGATWTLANDDRKLRQRAFYYTHIVADPQDRDIVYALNTGFYKSTDGGKTFPVAITVPHGDNHDLWIAPNDPQRMINSNDGGGNVSFNGGRTWTDQDFPTAQLYHVATTRDFPYHVCGAQQDNSTACVPSDTGPYLRDPRARAGSWLYAVGGGESGYIAPHPVDPDLFFAGSQGALVTRYRRSTGFTRDITIYPRFFSGEPSKDLKERSQWTFPIVFSPVDPRILYATTQHLWRTTNEGQSWERISPDLTRADPKTLDHSGGPITHDENGPEVFGTIFTIGPSRHDVNTIWTGSDDGLVYLTRDGGKNWTNVTPGELPELARISIVEASPHKPGTAYVAAKRYLVPPGDRAPYLFRTDDYGRTWTKIVRGIRAGDYVHTVREDPKRSGLLYAGTEHGIYVSWDNGDDWRSLSLNLPDVQVSDIVVEENDLVIATHGRSMWVLDALSPVRQTDAEARSATVHLFTPADGVRRAIPVVIDYLLQVPADTVAIEILDGSGSVVRRAVGTAAEKDDRAGSQREWPFPQFAPTSIGTRAGLNRFVWDLRYTGAATFPGMVLWRARPEDGPLAPPGTYRVRLTANGQTVTRPFRIRIDPRVKGVTEADVTEQFALAMKIRDRTSEANEAVVLVRELVPQIEDRAAKARLREITTAANALVRQLTEVEEAVYQVRNRSNQDPLNFPIRLNNRIAQLQGTVEMSDARPTDQAYVVFKELSDELDAELSKLRSAVTTDLTVLNRMLARRKLPPVEGALKKRTTSE